MGRRTEQKTGLCALRSPHPGGVYEFCRRFWRILPIFRRKILSGGVYNRRAKVYNNRGQPSILRKGEKHMKKMIAKKIYDTDTASVVKKVTSGYFGDPAGYEETLYVTPDGSYFLYTNGGEASVHPTEEIKRMSKATAERWVAEN